MSPTRDIDRKERREQVKEVLIDYGVVGELSIREIEELTTEIAEVFGE
jgi:hypothetical protein